MNENGPQRQTETIQVLGGEPGNQRWNPRVGSETFALLENLRELDQTSKEIVRSEAIAVLAKTVPPAAQAGDETGLVIGHVQSGKTMSFTTVAALAHDNGYRMVIVITGVSKPLFEQSKARLQHDLQLLTRRDRKWQHFSNPRGNDRQSMVDTLAEWRDPSTPPSERRTILITVMKNHTHLEKLRQVLSSLDLREVPVLVIDDEADQAGLNTLVNMGAESTTYRRLLSLRDLLPHHTFLQYTATPQAPLLINLIDVLSPNFADVLTPGADYVGGREFFIDHPHLVRTIPSAEIPARDDNPTEPPPSLLDAMRIFFLGVAAGLVLDDGRGNRSMMVHPSQLRTGHSLYFHWVSQIKDQWSQLLSLDTDDPDRRDLVEDFRNSYDDLRITAPELPSLETVLGRLHHAVRRTQIHEVNSRRGPTPQVDWSRDYPHILVGGQSMDRGFTVEGLTVTYMPRSVGVGNADTIQQRARFFGYKRRYLGYCRVYLEDQVRDAYRLYVEHEEDVRQRLVKHRETNKPLDAWKRAFFLDRTLRPTRNCVLQLDYMQDTISDDWFVPKAPHDSAEATRRNREVVKSFKARLTLGDDEGHERRTKAQRHAVALNVPLKYAYEDLLTQLRITRARDSQKFTGMLLQIGAFLEANTNATTTIYFMSGGETRERTLENDEIPTLFQGANFTEIDGERVMTYPGDFHIRSQTGLTIQVHTLKVTGADESVESDNVVAVAVWVPSEMAIDWLSQAQGAS